MMEMAAHSSRQLDIFGGSFHNTVPLQGDELSKAETKAQKQEDIVYKLFRDHRHASFTGFEAWMQLGQQWPLTSVRRAIANLVKEGRLKATGERRDGGYGMPTNCWTYSEKN